MSLLLKGKEVADRITELSVRELEEYREKGIVLQIATLRIGASEADIAYEKMIGGRCAKLGILHRSIVMASDSSQEELIEKLEELNKDEQVHGVLLFRPFPKQMDDDTVRNRLKAEKDIDGITDASLSGIFIGKETGYPPCTAQAVMELLNQYEVELTGKNITVIGRSMVVGKPLSMMLLQKNATVKICHSYSRDYLLSLKEADIVISCVGRARYLKAEHFSENQIVIDVGINTDKEGGLCGDVDFDSCKEKVKAITPVPGGVGSITTAVLIRHLIKAAEKQIS